MVFQSNVGGFIVFPVCGVWFNLQDLRFFSTYFVPFFVRMLGLILIFQADLVPGHICAP
jgi:hypothetical protein